jgi:arogenate dehydrogenase (NADP+)
MKIGIVGLGLIGGSLGFDLRTQGHEVVGMSRQEATCQQAIARGAVDRAEVDGRLLATAEVIFICTPLSHIAATVTQLIPHLSAATILTDVGSVKAPVVAAVTPLWPNFVGGHPLAGTAESGIAAAQPDLFAGNPYVLTPTATTPAAALATVETLVRSLAATLYHCAPTTHDRAVAWISHLPVMTSASLIAACLGEADPTVRELAQNLASSGFRDTSRVGGGNPELGVLMAEHNRAALLQALMAYRTHLDRLIGQIDQNDWPALMAELQTTQQARPQFLRP